MDVPPGGGIATPFTSEARHWEESRNTPGERGLGCPVGAVRRGRALFERGRVLASDHFGI